MSEPTVITRASIKTCFPRSHDRSGVQQIFNDMLEYYHEEVVPDEFAAFLPEDFAAAAEIWLAERTDLSHRTVLSYRAQVNRVLKHAGVDPLPRLRTNKFMERRGTS